MATISDFQAPTVLQTPDRTATAGTVSRMECRVLICDETPQWASIPHRQSAAGNLDIFAAEIMFQIFSYLDIAALINFRRANYATFERASAWLPFQMLITHASDTLRAIETIGSLKFVNALELFKVMKTQRCTFCGSTGPFLFIPLLKRSCWKCIESFKVFKVSTIKRCYGLSDPDFVNVPTFRTCPGKYGIPLRNYNVIQHLISGKAAEEARLSADNYDLQLVEHRRALVMASFEENLARWRARTNGHTQALGSMLAPRSHQPLTWRQRFSEGTTQYNYLVTTTLPFVDLPNRIVQRHRYCNGCIYERWIFKTQTRYKMTDEDLVKQMERETLFKASEARLAQEFVNHFFRCRWVTRYLSRGNNRCGLL
ncbi:hypothetical protein PRK78_005892 [Emydomyces testavorans]|uniref:F-box domain-containing protein n=1 Tax=Emydomyces testavorans TaxID=2070801 RepID=A0AAF0DKP1_9EURO|nr:hypothetical protein PRK78_005892 [Emydomyces testavorans]